MTDVVGHQADNICDYILDNKDLYSDETLESLFQSYKKQMKGMESRQTAEYLLLQNNGYSDCNNLGKL
jgi:hypothetical protein